MQSNANILEFLRAALANGPVSVQELQMRARAAELLRPEQPISQCKSFRTIADKIGVQRYQADRRWFWMLPPAGQTADAHPASGLAIPGTSDGNAAAQVSPSTPRPAAVATGHGGPAAAETESPAAAPIADFAHMTREQFIKASIENRRALATEAYAESKVRVARYFESGDLADLFPEQ